ncbi:MAG: glycosyltransferase, partial [Halieaceae bacterium]|nr:glycosyltransferase [Halieaceae bacterium]
MEHYLRDLMLSLSKRGIDNAALVHQSDITVGSSAENYESQGQRLSITRAAVWARLLFTPISPSFGWLLSRAINQQQPDILHIHMPNVSAFWALLLPRARRIPWVVHWHSDVLASKHSLGLRLFYTFYSPFERALLRRCRAIIATSAPYLETSATLRDFQDKCTVVPLGLDPISLPLLPPDKPLAQQYASLQVLAIGRLTYYKGFEYLIKALAELQEVELHLVGTGDRENSLKALTTKLGLAGRVHFHGHLHQAELAHQFRACDCLCLPSVERTEAFGMVLLEAMFFSKATIVSDLPGSGVGWVVEGSVTGLKVAPGDSVALGKSLQILHLDRAKMHALGEAGRARYDRLFHIDQSSKGVLECYRAALGGNADLGNQATHERREGHDHA